MVLTARSDWRLWAMLGVAFAAMGGWLWHVPLNHDSAFLMLAGGRWLDGQRLYFDQFLINPPLGPWLHAGVVAVDRALGGVTPDPFALQLWPVFVLGAIAVGLGLGGAVLGRDAPHRERRALMLLVAFAALAVAPVFDFGQRDHLFAVCAFPYVVLAGARHDRVAVPWTLAALVGAFAFFGVALKPHFALLPLTLEVVLRLRARNLMGAFRPETLALAGLMIGYALVVAGVYPEYFSTNLHLYTKIFFAFTQPLVTLLIRPELGVALVAAVAWARAPGVRDHGQVVMAVAAMGAALAIFLLQKKGWSYQRAPLFAFAVWALGWLATGEATAARRAWAVAGLVMALLLVALRGAYDNDYARTVVPSVARHADGGAAYVFTTNVSVPYPGLLYAGVTPASRFNTLWMLPGLVRTRADQPGALGEVETFARQAVLDDFRLFEPTVVAVDARSPKPYFNGVEFDYLDWALNDPRFAWVWGNYQRVDQAFGFDIYVRKPEGEGRP